MTFFYRFRSTDRLLGDSQELENQSIYFARPEQLNDPVEGFRNVFWSADHIAWKNLFTHYLRCLERACSLLILAGETHHKITASDLPVALARDDFPTEDYRQLFLNICNDFFGRADVATYIESIANAGRKAYRDELRFHLQILHYAALGAISAAYQNNGLMAKAKGSWPNTEDTLAKLNDTKFLDVLSKATPTSGKPEEAQDMLFRAFADTNSQMRLIHRYNKTVDADAPNKNFVIVDFPGEYVKAIDALLFPPWYTSCFMSDCTNSAVWGHYGANHTGISLVFKSDEVRGRHVLPLRGINGFSSSGPVHGILQLEFTPIEYGAGFNDIDFFRSIGRVPMPILTSTWYKDADGNISSCAQDLFTDEPAWRERYWKAFRRDITRKTQDWAYEREYRLLLFGSVTDYSADGDRALTYDFKSLKGLIFGVNTTTENKLKVMEIIERKCPEHGIADFKYYQAFYSPRDKCVKYSEWKLLERKK